MRALRRRVEKFLFQRLFVRRIERRKKSAALIYRYCDEIREAEGLRTVAQRFRLSVIKAQKIIRNFLSVRRTKIEVLLKYWSLKEEKYQAMITAEEEKAAAKGAKGKGKAKPAKAKVKNWLPVPDELKKEMIRTQLKTRKKDFEEQKEELMMEAEVQMAKNLIKGVEVGPKCVVFRMLPSEEEMFALIVEAQERVADKGPRKKSP